MPHIKLFLNRTKVQNISGCLVLQATDSFLCLPEYLAGHLVFISFLKTQFKTKKLNAALLLISNKKSHKKNFLRF